MDLDHSLGPVVSVDFTLAVGPGRLEASLPVPAGNITVTQLLPVLQSLTSHIVDSAVQIANAEGFQVSCRAGCGACCRQLVPLSIFEAEALAQWIRSLPVEQQQALEGRFHSALVALESSGILARLHSAIWDETTAKTQALAADYLAAKIPCPFLQDESCSIHPIRPLICREYLVVSPAQFCAAPSKALVVPLPVPVKPSRLLYKLGAQVDPGTPGWLPLVFLFVWMRGRAHPGDAIAGPGPELLYELVQRLS